MHQGGWAWGAGLQASVGMLRAGRRQPRHAAGTLPLGRTQGPRHVVGQACFLQASAGFSFLPGVFSGRREWIPGLAGAVATAGISWACVTGRGSRGTLLALGLGSCMDAELPRLAVAGGSFFSSEREPLGEFLGCLGGGEGQEHGVPAGAGEQLAVEIFQDLSPRNLPPSHPRKAWEVFIFLNFPL